MKFGTRSALTPAGWESMVALLDPLRLYDLSPESFVSRELMAYAAGLALFRQRLEQCREQLAQQAARLEMLSPLKILGRGYALAYHGEELVRSAAQVQPGDRLRLRLAEGEVMTEVVPQES